MSEDRRAYVHEATLLLADGADPRAPGGAVTVQLCGDWEHDGPCTWPHNSAIDGDAGEINFRTIFIAAADDEPEVRERIDHALGASSDWELVVAAPRRLRDHERELAARLMAAPYRNPRG
jgi:hypothetical protein